MFFMHSKTQTKKWLVPFIFIYLILSIALVNNTLSRYQDQNISLKDKTVRCLEDGLGAIPLSLLLVAIGMHFIR